MSNNKEDFDAQVSAFKEKYPDFKPAKAIEVLNLIMTSKNAKEILEGKKQVEYRAYTDHYIGRLFDKDVLEFLKKHGEEEDVIKAQEDGIVAAQLPPARPEGDLSAGLHLPHPQGHF